jgi:hypothetical protein
MSPRLLVYCWFDEQWWAQKLSVWLAKAHTHYFSLFVWKCELMWCAFFFFCSVKPTSVAEPKSADSGSGTGTGGGNDTAKSGGNDTAKSGEPKKKKRRRVVVVPVAFDHGDEDDD